MYQCTINFLKQNYQGDQALIELSLLRNCSEVSNKIGFSCTSLANQFKTDAFNTIVCSDALAVYPILRMTCFEFVTG